MQLLRSLATSLFATALLAIGLFAVARTPAAAQSQSPAADSTRSALPLVFLDCRAHGCDEDFLRTELAWMNFVRDPNGAMVHIIATSRGTASGGAELTLTFERTNAIPLDRDSLIAIIPQSATDDQSRRVLSRAIGQGMLRFIQGTRLAEQLTVSYKPTTASKSDTRGAKDKWHLWVYRVSTNGFTNGDENYKSLSLNSSVRASRITEQWKINFSVDGDYRENSYTLGEDEKLRTYQHGWSGNVGVVKSLSPRWSLGGTANASSSVQSNQDLLLRIGPALEFDVYPYAQSTRRQVIFRYTPFLRIANYTEYTIFNKLAETHPEHQ
ncbi:MAG: hypothetical protein ABI120_03910, partial [Gemmatimonadaceae bacterium]